MKHGINLENCMSRRGEEMPFNFQCQCRCSAQASVGVMGKARMQYLEEIVSFLYIYKAMHTVSSDRSPAIQVFPFLGPMSIASSS
jgi:hypothetical protein